MQPSLGSLKAEGNDIIAKAAAAASQVAIRQAVLIIGLVVNPLRRHWLFAQTAKDPDLKFLFKIWFGFWF